MPNDQGMDDIEFEKFAIGQPVSRLEDPMLLRGDGIYTDDINLDGQAYAYVLRSPFAHGHIRKLDVNAAAMSDGVLCVLTAKELVAAGVNPLNCRNNMESRDGSPIIKPDRPCLATEKVRFRGEAVALIVAESLAQAKDASELIEFDVDVLMAVTDARASLADGAPQLHDAAPNNRALDWEIGNPEEMEQILSDAHHVTRLTLRNNRVAISPIEPRAAVGEYDAASDRFTLHVPTQGVFGFTTELSERILGIPREKLRIKTNRVGGSFGMKSAPYPEYAPVLIAAKHLGRPVKWCDERSDSFLSDQHGRDGWAEVALAFGDDAKLRGASITSHGNAGAYFSAVGPHMYTNNVRRNFPGVYRLPFLHARSFAVFTNTNPIGAFRGAGRPESIYYFERAIDTAAREMGIDRVELRRLNLLRPDEIPYIAAGGMEYDSGDFPAVMEDALKAADWDGFEGRREVSATKGMLRGLGIATYLEATGAPAREMGRIRFEDDGAVTMVTGSLDYGQGHAVSFAQVVGSKLGIPLDRFRLIQGDSDELIAGQGSGGSKTMISGGTIMLHTAEKVIENGRKIASHVLEAAEIDIEFDAGQFIVAGTDRSVSLFELVERSRSGLPDGVPPSMDAEITEDPPPSAFPNGCHIAEIEIEPETGVVQIDRYTIVDDFGTLINPMLVEGQVHGGIAQGIGQALMENIRYDDDGQLISGSFMDYAMPRADNMPNFKFGSHPVPATTNPLGAKGCGEAGCSGSLPAVMNAIVDVLVCETGATHIDMPATPEQVWRALQRKGV